jgi:hypothetical protein
MATTILEYYTGELAEWSHDVNLHLDEMDQLEDKLTAVIRRNSIPGIAGEVEKHLQHLEKITGILQTLQYNIKEQETLLHSYSAKPIKEDALKNDIENKQAVLRLNMQAAEKEFIDVKFGCYDFLSSTLKS